MKVFASSRALLRLKEAFPGFKSFASAAGSHSQTNAPKKPAPQQNPKETKETKDEKAGMVYKNPEYFHYDEYSFAEMEIAMRKFRLPQPNSQA